MPKVNYREASKIQVLEAPRLPPGTCAVCGSSSNDDRQYMDLGIDIEFYGVFYLCTFCFLQAVNTLGCLTKEQTTALEDENNRLRQRIINFEAKEAALDGAINALRDSGILDYASSRSVISDPGVESKTNQSIEQYYADIVARDKSKSDDNSPKPSSFVSEQGPDDLSKFTIDTI